MQVAVVAVRQFPEVAGAGIDIRAWVVQFAETVYPEVPGRARPKDLHDAVRVGTRARGRLEVAFAPRHREQQGLGEVVLERGRLEAG